MATLRLGRANVCQDRTCLSVASCDVAVVADEHPQPVSELTGHEGSIVLVDMTEELPEKRNAGIHLFIADYLHWW